MILKNIHEICLADITELIDNKVLENKGLEYKAVLHLQKDDEKKEFLFDIASFANASGGDIVYGVYSDSKSGLPARIEPLELSNTDAEISKIENLIATGVRPRIQGLSTRVIDTNGKYVVIIRIPRSLNAPHMVVFKASNKFYSRNSNGKFLLDVDELRSLFNSGAVIAEQIRNFRSERISRIQSDDTFIEMADHAPKLVLHLLPTSAFTGSDQTNFAKFVDPLNMLRPIAGGGWDIQRNLEGFIAYSPGVSYTQLFNNGIIEAVDLRILAGAVGGLYIPSTAIERNIIEACAGYIQLLQNLSTPFPLNVFVTMTGIRNHRFAAAGFMPGFQHDLKPRKDVLMLQPALVDSPLAPLQKMLRPTFDSMWHAYGFSKSSNFDDHDNWKPKN